MSGEPFEKVGSEVTHDGIIGQVRVERFRHADGEEVQREVIGHMGAVGIVAHDDEHVWLVRQPREAVGEWTLEIPAGKLDEEGESSLTTAQRELAEEIGKAAEHWEPLDWFYSSAGFTDEKIELFLATGLSDAAADSGEDERIEIVPWPLERLDEAIAESRDAKTLVALAELRERRRR
jgi:8-oxo-dGTP pyrophosphatase MutT (NUDIX family)